MAQLTVVLLIAAVSFCSVQAQKNMMDALSQNKLDLFAKIVKCAGAEQAFKASDSGKVTVLAPTDAAILAFLKSMGLSPQDVLAEEPLCDALLRYHVMPYDLTSSMIIKKDMTAQTMEPRSYLTLNKGPLGVTVKDMQGNVAKVTKGDIKIGDAMVHTVDRVLLSGDVFYTVADAIKYHSIHYTELIKALTAAGLLKDLMDPKKPFKGTFLAPTDAGFKKLSSTPAMADLKKVLLYHVLKDKLVLPGAVTEGTKYATALPGHSVQFKFSTADRKDQFGKTTKYTLVDVIPETGKPARMVKHNMFAGQGVIHGIDSVLIPKLGAGITEKGPVTGHRKLLETPGAQGSDLSFQSSQALDRTSAAIASAASGATSTRSATRQGSIAAVEVGRDFSSNQFRYYSDEF